MIIHLDADAFFASVEQAADPRLRGRPVAVGGSRRGIIASASYEARRLGVHTPMPTARALKLCPNLIVVPGDYEKYEHFSRMMFTYAYDFTPQVEVQGIDEGYLDVRGHPRLTAEAIATAVRKAVHDTLKITVSEGVGSNKLISQIASKLHKPDRLTGVPPGQERAFLAPLAATWLPGVGPKAGLRLTQAGLTTIGRVAETRPDDLALLVGAAAPELWNFAQGIDPRPVVPEAPAAKSYGAQETFEQDQTDEVFLLAKLHSLTDGLMARVRADGKMARTLAVRIRYNDMDECERSASLDEPSCTEVDFHPLLRSLLRKAWTRRVSLRLVAVKVSNVYDLLYDPGLPLGGDLDRGQKAAVARVIDDIRSQFGRGAILRGHDLWLRHHEQEVPQPPRQRRSSTRRHAAQQPTPQAKPTCAFLNLKSHYSFLDSLLSPADAVRLAAEAGAQVVALTDPNLHGMVEFCQAAREAGIRPVVAAALQVTATPSEPPQNLNAYVLSPDGQVHLCHLLSLPRITRLDLYEARTGLLVAPAADCGPEVRYAQPADRRLYAVVQSIRTLTLLAEPHPEKRRGAFHFHRDAAPHPDLLKTLLDAETYQPPIGGPLLIPSFTPEDGRTSREFLARLAFEGARQRYGTDWTRVRPQLEEELAIIGEVGYEDYFLLTWDTLQHCRARGIDWITRGSAADSLVCYCLGISGVCPVRFDLYFKRFLNRDRMALHKLPDIDIDFPHDRRDEVVRMLLDQHGAHAAIVGGFNTYQGRSAVADIAKVLGASERQVRQFTERFPHASASQVGAAAAASQEFEHWGMNEEPYRSAIDLAARLDGRPRHAKMHPCGLVLCRHPIRSLTPTFAAAKEGWPTTHLDMHAVEAIGMVKMDLLAQAGLSVLRDTRQALGARGIDCGVGDGRSLEPWKDEAIWSMIAVGESRGVHHIESPAMLNLARMCGVGRIDDLVAIVSVIRPGAANGLKKSQFARRCRGLEPAVYAHASLEPVLRSTYGVVAYEEHIAQICEAFSGLPAGRGDLLRRALVKGKTADINTLRMEFVDCAQRAGRTPQEIAAVWDLLIQFQGYAFCRAHSTAYAVEAYEAAHLKRRWPLEFLAAVLEHGKGFYPRLVYSIEVRRLGFGFRLPDVNSPHSTYFADAECAVIEVPLKQVKGLKVETLGRIVQARGHRPFGSVEDFALRVGPSSDEMEALLRVGALDGITPSRTAQFWAWRRAAQWSVEGNQGLLFAAASEKTEGSLPGNRAEPSHHDRLAAEIELLSFPVSGHPLELYPEVDWSKSTPIRDLAGYVDQAVEVTGLIIEHRVHTQIDGRPMKFLTLCDPTGTVDAEVFADAYARFGVLTARYPVVTVCGIVRAFDGGGGHALDVEIIMTPPKR
ncbi:MAG: DNA polymerase IV [Candidatus Methylacidiphilales bacterium]|nr:DNA polymerase IV [Candidatus Methylacidiphilales bacterium]